MMKCGEKKKKLIWDLYFSFRKISNKNFVENLKNVGNRKSQNSGNLRD